MSTLLAKIFQQAEITFSMRNRDAFKSNFMLLRKLVDSLSMKDFNLNQILFTKRAFQVKNKAPCTFINLYEKKNCTFSMSIFILNENYTMPCHNHPNMYGILKVISGNLKAESYTRLTQSTEEDEILVKVEEPKHLNEMSEHVVLYPQQFNFHELTALNGPAAFFDILAPPYSETYDTSSDARHCSFFKKVMVNSDENNSVVKLINIPVPDHYYCDTIFYEQPDFMR